MVVKRAPEILWHYTSMDALDKILASQRLRATHADSLNDPEERRLVYKPFEDTVRRIWPEGNVDNKLWHRNDDVSYRLAPFVTSFSANPDNLLLWKSYADDASGVALGFRTEALRSAHTDLPGSTVDLHPMSYDQKEVVLTSQSHAVDLVAKIYADRKDRRHPERFEHWTWMNYYALLSGVAATYKTPGWQQEEEWRLVARVGAPAQVADDQRSGPLMEQYWKHKPGGQPCCDLTLTDWADSITEVTVGPWGDVEAVAAVLKTHGCTATSTKSPTLIRRPSR